MAPTLVREPFHRDGWVYEEKVNVSAQTGVDYAVPRPLPPR